MTIWSQFRNKPSEEKPYSFVVGGPAYLAYKAFFLKLGTFGLGGNSLLEQDTAINTTIGYNIIHKKESSLGIKLIGTSPFPNTHKDTPRSTDCLINYNSLHGLGIGIQGSRIIWKNQNRNENYLEVFLDARIQHMLGSTSYYWQTKCQITPYTIIGYATNKARIDFKIAPLIDTTLMVEYIQNNWIFDAGYTLYTAQGIELKTNKKYTITLEEKDETPTGKLPAYTTHNPFLAIGYAWKNNNRNYTPFIGVTAGLSKTPKEKVGSYVCLRVGLAF